MKARSAGWPRDYRAARYFDHPFLGEDACRLLDRGARTIGLEVLNIDETPDDTYPGGD